MRVLARPLALLYLGLCLVDNKSMNSLKSSWLHICLAILVVALGATIWAITKSGPIFIVMSETIEVIMLIVFLIILIREYNNGNFLSRFIDVRIFVTTASIIFPLQFLRADILTPVYLIPLMIVGAILGLLVILISLRGVKIVRHLNNFILGKLFRK